MESWSKQDLRHGYVCSLYWWIIRPIEIDVPRIKTSPYLYNPLKLLNQNIHYKILKYSTGTQTFCKKWSPNWLPKCTTQMNTGTVLRYHLKMEGKVWTI